MTLEPILILGVRDIRTALKNRSVSIPMIVVPVVILVIMPVVLLRSLIGAGGEDMLSDLQPLLEGLPPSAVYLAELPLTEAGIILITHYILAPLFLVIPLMVASVLGAESFAGEKERGTLEALLYTPLSRIQLLAGKTLAAVAPAIVLAWASFLAYATVVNVAAWPVMGRIFFPPLMWWALMLWVVPAAAVLSLAVMVMVSMRVSSFMEAFQIGGMVVIPVVALMLAQVTGVLFLSLPVMLLVGLVLWVTTGVLVHILGHTLLSGDLLTRM